MTACRLLGGDGYFGFGSATHFIRGYTSSMGTKQQLMRLVMPFIRSFRPIVRLYWRTMKPKTYGVKVLITHPTADEQVLLVRHAYGNQVLWNIPGGGYNPKRENVLDAARREVREELGVELVNSTVIGSYESSEEGKRDTVFVLHGSIHQPDAINRSPEIREIVWKHYIAARVDGGLATVTRRALTYHFGETTR